MKQNKKKTEEQKTEEQKQGREKTIKNSRIKDQDNYDIVDDSEDNEHKPNGNYNKYIDQNNCIEAYTGKTSTFITIVIDYAFLCCDLFIECFKTSSLCPLTKNGFHFNYQYEID